MNNKDEILWASGLFEGEGCFTLHKEKSSESKYPLLQLGMTDEDSVRRFHQAVGVGSVYGPIKGIKDHYKDSWRWRVKGFEKVQAVTAMLWIGLGQRRRKRAIEVLATARGNQPRHTRRDATTVG